MKRLLFVLAAFAALPGAGAQDNFSLSFSGAGSQAGSAGDGWSSSYDCVMSHEGDGTGAQGWSISVSAESASITAIQFEGSQAEALFSGGFKKSELTTPPSPNPGSCPGGADGAVSAVVLSFVEARELPTNAGTSIGSVVAEGTIPAGGGSARLLYVDGCRGSGQPVQNNVTQGGATVKPSLGSLDVTLIEVVSCCGERLNVGFSAATVSSASPNDSIAEDESGLCSAGGGSIVAERDPGASDNLHAYANISSENAGGGAQGWSFSIALNGADVELAGVQVEGTPGVDNNFSGGFKKTEIIDPAKNGDQRGCVSAVVLSFVENRVLPSTGTESVLDISVSSAAAQADADQVGSVKFQSGLRGSGQPVANAITVDGATEAACNVLTAEAQVVFRLKPPPAVSNFQRGNPNGDSKTNIADAVWIINELFRGGPASACPDAADINDDELVDTSDATYLIAHLFQGGSPPPPPYPDCGLDDDASPTSCPSGSVAACP